MSFQYPLSPSRSAQHLGNSLEHRRQHSESHKWHNPSPYWGGTIFVWFSFFVQFLPIICLSILEPWLCAVNSAPCHNLCRGSLWRAEGTKSKGQSNLCETRYWERLYLWSFCFLSNIRPGWQCLMLQVFATFLNSFLCELLCRGESDPEKRGECKKRYCQTRE